jgi:hypothetical protein
LRLKRCIIPGSKLSVSRDARDGACKNSGECTESPRR